jgi:hypothetical protein
MTVVGAFSLSVAPSRPVPQARLSVTADGSADRITFTHDGGSALAVQALTIRIRIDGTGLAHQPPVPFFAAEGFRAGPTGPFNVASDDRWTRGERASLRLARTNSPRLVAGRTVTVTVVNRGRPVAMVTTTAR